MHEDNTAPQSTLSRYYIFLQFVKKANPNNLQETVPSIILSYLIEPQPLGNTNDIRKEIKTLLSQVTAIEQDATGNKKYGGETILEMISHLKAALKIDEVGKKWGLSWV